MPAASTRTSTWPAPGVGTGTSSRRSASGLPTSRTTTAFTEPALPGRGLPLRVGAGRLAAELGAPPLHERRRALVVVRALADARVVHALDRLGLAQRHVQRVVDVLLRALDHDRAVGVDRLGQLRRLG